MKFSLSNAKNRIKIGAVDHFFISSSIYIVIFVRRPKSAEMVVFDEAYHE